MAHLDRPPVAQFKVPRFRLVWNHRSVPEANWYIGLIGFYHKETPRRWWIVVSGRGVVGWSVVSAVAGFFLGTAALAFIWSRNPFNQITYADLVLPTRWSELKHKRGLGLVDEGLHELKGRRYATAIMLLTKGVAFAPEEQRGRFALAAIYVQIGFVHRGLQLLEEGLEYGKPNKAYRELTFRVANYLEDYEKIVELAKQTEATLSPDDLSTLRWVIGLQAGALEKLKRHDEIDALRAKYAASPFFALESAWARTQAARGSPQKALQELKANPERFGLAEDRFGLEISLHQALGKHAAALDAVKAWQKEEPANPLPRIEEVFVQIKAGQIPAAYDALEQYLLYFGNQPTALLLAFKRLGALGDPAWIRFARKEIAAKGAPRIDLNILYVQALLESGQIVEAQTEFLKTKDAIAAAKAVDGGWSQGTFFLLQLLMGDSPSNRAQLLSYCTNSRLGPEAFRFLLRSLRAAQLDDVASEVAALATNRFPAFKDDIRPLTSSANARSARAVDIRIPETVEIKNLVGAKIELRKLREAIAAQDWADARMRLRSIEQAGFKEIQSDVRLCRITIQGYTREQSEMTGTLQLYLTSPNVDQTALRQLATAWDTPELKDSALTLCRLTVERFPQARWAADLRKKLESELTVAPLDEAAAMGSKK